MSFSFKETNGNIICYYYDAEIPKFMLRKECILGLVTLGNSSSTYKVHLLTTAETIDFTATSDEILSLISIMGW